MYLIIEKFLKKWVLVLIYFLALSTHQGKCLAFSEQGMLVSIPDGESRIKEQCDGGRYEACSSMDGKEDEVYYYTKRGCEKGVGESGRHACQELRVLCENGNENACWDIRILCEEEGNDNACKG